MAKPIIARREVTERILRHYNLHAKKKLGQNFLVDESVVRDIALAAQLSQDSTVVEIGPGIGTLTQALAETGARVVAVELDSSLIPVLKDTLQGYPKLELVNADILELDLAPYVGTKPFTVAANLPYYITTPILFALLERDLAFDRLVVMVQKEVAQRLTARPCGKDYGALTVALNYYTEPKLLRTVPHTSFLPAPQVDSAVVVATRRAAPPVAAPKKTFFQVVKAAFSLRRKMLRNSLRNIGLNAPAVDAWLNVAQIDGTRRAETLSLSEFDALALTLPKFQN